MFHEPKAELTATPQVSSSDAFISKPEGAAEQPDGLVKKGLALLIKKLKFEQFDLNIWPLASMQVRETADA